MQPIILKGVVTSLHMDANGETIAQVTSPPSNGMPVTAPVGEDYKFEPYCGISLRASDLGNPPIGATVKVTVELS
jgi:hypothetical protein